MWKQDHRKSSAISAISFSTSQLIAWYCVLGDINQLRDLFYLYSTTECNGHPLAQMCQFRGSMQSAPGALAVPAGWPGLQINLKPHFHTYQKKAFKTHFVNKIKNIWQSLGQTSLTTKLFWILMYPWRYIAQYYLNTEDSKLLLKVPHSQGKVPGVVNITASHMYFIYAAVSSRLLWNSMVAHRDLNCWCLTEMAVKEIQAPDKWSQNKAGLVTIALQLPLVEIAPRTSGFSGD